MLTLSWSSKISPFLGSICPAWCLETWRTLTDTSLLDKSRLQRELMQTSKKIDRPFGRVYVKATLGYLDGQMFKV